MNSAINQYNQVKVQTGIAAADPHRLVLMLLDGAMERVLAAKMHMLQNSVSKKGELIGSAISIVDGLRASLDKEQGGQIADNLEALYDYMGRQLLMANMKNEPQLLDEVTGLLRQVKEAWEAIGEQVRGSAPSVPETPEVRLSIGV